MSTQYDARMQATCDYIHQHLDQILTVSELSQVAHFSEFHFHRQFRAYVGVNVARYITQLRLKRAAYQLGFHPEKSVTDIALDAQFEFSESFSRAFKKEFGQSPRDFRKQPDWQKLHQTFLKPTRRQEEKMKVDIQKFERTLIAVFEHRGPAPQVNHSAMKFIDWRKSTGLSPVSSRRTFGLIYDDPAETEPSKFRFDICGEVHQAVPANSHGVVNKEIPEGRVAVVRHTGSHDELDKKVIYLYGTWLPESGETLRDFPCFFHYQNFFPEVDEHELVTDVYLPIE
ncbi:putative Transcriptional regulator, AraC family [Vibrio nigripulchritudo SFn27]|uniref:Putative Transcriptional regulator, AraC family n=1 Tax=Vibrio nigripulchritudo TaxID=28173 RepID=U4KI07_9VIBR|nr:AraC family transcriptional regulator [Vibrio nigripulchritudo]CCN80589.1 putative Transcriptional regulator, AraC family [Vibrio nigripulchritudo BLFn1]CCN90599.1 putative Transcriptional regulator, AraC family [Vibrio nigripulchritudo SFn27]CCN93464.1 putative Transcriptional regulator, AraC family [Vibrio nigripulchritudo ENn2]CCO41872.1 putative Transcriptional regulator, AraC family [Vibrio nigripulchritudo SFn135]CCO52017.1 putative Transcriptional regulator, AraC family [Vibrio nigri